MKVQFINSIHDIAAGEWNNLCTDNPFIQHQFFAALEDSGSTTQQTGWTPHHAIVVEHGKLIAALPLFIKTHSYGEYVFDWAWADAYEQHGLDYYPKLVSAIPFTPSSGQRLLMEPNYHNNRLLQLITDAIKTETLSLGASGWHCLFPQLAVHTALTAQQFSPRLGCQFQWINNSYQSFDEFLALFNSRKRKMVNKERRKVYEQGLQLTIKSGREVTNDEWSLFHELYHRTYLKRSGRHGYLGPTVFHQLAQTMADNIVLVIAYHQHEMVAAALNFRDSNTLYGRYWGCKCEFEFLHFETCYYQGIEYCIHHNLHRFDSGAQGEHKIQRGFTPVETYSNHWIVDPRFKSAIDDFLVREERGVREYIKQVASYLPFKKT
jgi:predicted N-acyltransferase